MPLLNDYIPTRDDQIALRNHVYGEVDQRRVDKIRNELVEILEDARRRAITYTLEEFEKYTVFTRNGAAMAYADANEYVSIWIAEYLRLALSDGLLGEWDAKYYQRFETECNEYVLSVDEGDRGFSTTN